VPRRLFERAGTPEPTVSIVLAVYDPPHAALIAQLDAIAAQTSPDWECVVIDDASTDQGVVDLVTEWAGLANNRRLIRRADNGGIAAATNDGLDAASGTLVTICDHDDVIHPDAVAALIEHYEQHPDDDVVYTDEQLIDAEGVVLAPYAKPDYSPRRHLGHHFLAHLVAGRREAIADIRVRQEFEPSQDYDFWLRVIERSTAAGRTVGHIPQTLYSWRAISGSSALDAGEKPEMCDAVRRCAQAALDRRGIPRTATTVFHDGKPTTSVRLAPNERRGGTSTVSFIEIAADSNPTDLNDAVTAVSSDVICFVPDISGVDNEWAAPLVFEAVQEGVGAIGPKVVTEAGALVSIGRVIVPTLSDRFVGEPSDASGPWGAFFVVREVSALAPPGLTMSRDRFEQAGGFAPGMSLDVAAADLSIRLAAVGNATLIHPGVSLVVETPELAIDPRGLLAAREHHAAEWIERFDLRSRGEAEWTAPTTFEQLHTLLKAGDIDLVTSDVFDTLVTRPVTTPSDLFVRLARCLDLPAHVTSHVFASARRAAERRARTDQSARSRRDLVAASPGITEAELVHDPQVAAPEVTLHEIWEKMPESWGDRTAMLDAELALEAEALQPIPETVEAFRWARDAGVPVVLVSDIYLTSDQLSAVLANAGVDMSLVNEVVSSADHRLGKSHGLLAQTIEQRAVAPVRVAHLGDNEVADVETATKLGAHAIHVDVPSTQHHVDLPPSPLRAWSSMSGTDLGISAATRAVLVGAGRFETDQSFQYGAAVVGPVLTGFTRWVSETTRSLGASHVHCMLREGATIAELLETTASADQSDPTPIPLHVSRWVTMRAAVIDATPDELMTALARRADLTVDHVVRAFACDPARVRAVFGGDRADPNHIAEAYAALSADDVVRSQIIEHAAALRERVLVYLRSRLVLDDGPLVVADVGWGGTIQEGLTRILHAGGIEHEVVGLYLALSAPGEERLARGARMLSYLPNATDNPPASEHSRAVAHHADTIERIMTPAIGTLLDIDAAGNPVCRPVDHDPIPSSLQAAQRAMRLVVDRLADRSTGLSDLADERWLDPALRAAFAQMLSETVTSPSRPLAEALGSWPHDDVAGTAHRSIASSELAAATRYATARDLDLLDPSGRSWVAGLAGLVNPSLGAQLAAMQAGVALDQLAPESETGAARLSAFEVGSDLSELQIVRAVHVAPAGWSVIRLTGDVASLRSLRFDAGEHAALVEVAHFAVRLSTTHTFDAGVRQIDLGDEDLTWVDAHPLDEHRFAHRRGGHLLLDIAPELAAEVRSIEVTVGFRCWRLDDDDALARTPIARRVSDQTRRITSAVKRRL
jgi:FMN phosphatase YigB (HAD superfamily)